MRLNSSFPEVPHVAFFLLNHLLFTLLITIYVSLLSFDAFSSLITSYVIILRSKKYSHGIWSSVSFFMSFLCFSRACRLTTYTQALFRHRIHNIAGLIMLFVVHGFLSCRDTVVVFYVNLSFTSVSQFNLLESEFRCLFWHAQSPNDRTLSGDFNLILMLSCWKKNFAGYSFIQHLAWMKFENAGIITTGNHLCSRCTLGKNVL